MGTPRASPVTGEPETRIVTLSDALSMGERGTGSEIVAGEPVCFSLANHTFNLR